MKQNNLESILVHYPATCVHILKFLYVKAFQFYWPSSSARVLRDNYSNSKYVRTSECVQGCVEDLDPRAIRNY